MYRVEDKQFGLENKYELEVIQFFVHNIFCDKILLKGSILDTIITINPFYSFSYKFVKYICVPKNFVFIIKKGKNI